MLSSFTVTFLDEHTVVSAASERWKKQYKTFYPDKLNFFLNAVVDHTKILQEWETDNNIPRAQLGIIEHTDL